jgi:subtilisin family serine protease/putative cell wall-binding protein
VTLVASRAASILLALVVLAGLAAPVAASDALIPRPVATPQAETPPAPDATSKVVGGAEPVILADRVAVGWRDAGAEVETLQAQADGLAARGLSELSVAPPEAAAALDGPDVVATNGRPVNEVIAELQADPAIAYAEPVYQVTVAEVGSVTAVAVNDTKAPLQYSLDRMAVRDAWSLTRGANNIIAVLDTGISFVHADLAGRAAGNAAELGGKAGVDDDNNGFIDDGWGWDFVNSDGDPRDDNQHGTWVAGIIAANANNGQGIAGISWSDKILAVKTMGADGIGNTAALAAGIRYAANRGAKVINMSVGGFPYSQAVADAVTYAWGKGAVLVGAAGNNRLEETYYPASYPNVISVSATQPEDGFANWSSYGSAVDVSAPGADIWTTHCQGCSTSSAGGTGYAWVSGTSFATPNVSGVVALIRARYPTWTNQQVVDRLIATVDDLGARGKDNRFGYGRVNAYRAVGGSPPAVAAQPADALEGNNTFASARAIALGATIRPSINPAGDVDFLAVDVPRAGRFSVSVSAVVDTQTVPEKRSVWSSQPIDPIVDLYDAGGTLLQTVDNPTDSTATEVATRQVGPGRLVVGIRNWMPNGSPSAYTVSTSYVDNVAPAVTAVAPAGGSVIRDGSARPTLTFSEPVAYLSNSSIRLVGAAGTAVPAAVTYDANARRATLIPSRPLEGNTRYTLSASSAIKDSAGLALPAGSWTFTTGRVTARVAGQDRYATAAAVSATRFDPGVAVAYVALGSNFPDALAAGPAAARYGAPVLLVGSDTIPAATRTELTRLRPGRIIVVGSAGVISEGVRAALEAYTAGRVDRLSGADRYATAARISADAFPTPGVGVAYVALGTNFPDALAGGAAAAAQHGPVLLTKDRALPAVTAAELDRLNPSWIVVLGSSGAVSDAVLTQLRAYAPSVTRLAGPDRYATAVAVSKALAPNGSKAVYLATGTNFPDGLAGDPVAGLRGAPMLLAPADRLPPEVAAELQRLNPSTVIILGSSGVVSDGVRNAIAALWP